MDLPKNVPLSVPDQLLVASKFEIWSKGQKIESGATITQLLVEHEDVEKQNDGIKISIDVSDNSKLTIHKYIKEKFYFDVAFAIKDRLIIALLPYNSNVKNNNSYNAFINFAPFKTRENYIFENEMPYACSLFYNENDKLIRVTCSNGLNDTLIEFT